MLLTTIITAPELLKKLKTSHVVDPSTPLGLLRNKYNPAICNPYELVYLSFLILIIIIIIIIL